MTSSLVDLARVGDHVDDRAVVAVGEHAALRRAGGAGGVDERERVLRADARATRLELLGRALAPALAHLLERDRLRRARPPASSRVAGGRVDRRRSCAGAARWSWIAAIFASCSSFSQTTAHALGVGDHPQALLGGVGLVDRHHDRARARSRPGRRRTTRGGCCARMHTRSPGWMPRSIRPSPISWTISASCA